MIIPIDTTTLMTMDRMVLQGLVQSQENRIIALEATIEQMRASAVQAERDYQSANGPYRAIVQRWERVVRYVARLRRERSVQDGLAQQQAERIVALEGERVRTNATWNDAFNWLYVALTNRLEELDRTKVDSATTRERAELDKRNFADMDTLCTRAIEQRDQARRALAQARAALKMGMAPHGHIINCPGTIPSAACMDRCRVTRAALAGVAQDAPGGDCDDVKAGDDA